MNWFFVVWIAMKTNEERWTAKKYRQKQQIRAKDGKQWWTVERSGHHWGRIKNSEEL